MTLRKTEIIEWSTTPDIIWPLQCSCGHLYLEKYQFKELTSEGNMGFCWCGFCRTKRMVKPYKNQWQAEQAEGKE